MDGADAGKKPKQDVPPPTPMNEIQQNIFAVLKGQAMKGGKLADKVCAGDARRLYSRGKKKPGLLKEMITAGLIEHKHGLGYFRPDAPPSAER